MTDDTLLSTIKELAEQTSKKIGNAEWYLFGSAKFDSSSAKDIDLLVICETPAMADAVRRSVDLDCMHAPIHLSILTQDEESEIKFVKRQNCFRFF